jgi:aryl-alcohol dehydrogenase-like predicted oxidoreductase
MKLGFGTWGIGGKDYGPITSNYSLELINFALKKKINFFDTAPLYGNGRSERLLGTIIKKIDRTKIVIATKGGMLPHTGFDLKQDFSINNLQKDLQKSLRRLKTSYIDYYLLHSPNLKKINIKKIIIFFQRLKKKKIIKKFGVSLKSPNDIFFLKNFFTYLDVVEFNFNLFDQRAIDIKIFSLLKKNKIESICRTPLCFGFLQTQDINRNSLFSNDHRRKFWSNLQFLRWNSSKNFFLNFSTSNKYDDFSQFALHFCMSFDFDYVIPGMMKKEDILSNIKINSYSRIKKNTLNNIYRKYKELEGYIFVTKK